MVVWLIIGVVALLLFYVVLVVRRSIRQVVKMFKEETLSDVMEDQREQLAQTPKSIAAMTKVYLPQIGADFPAFDWPQVQQQAQNLLKQALAAITNSDKTPPGVSKEWDDQLLAHIENNRVSGQKEAFEQVRVHRTEIAHYEKHPGECVITLQLAVGCIHYIEREGALISGSKETREQSRYAISLSYIQDAQKLPTQGSAVGISCPHCGAPVISLGDKACAYCGVAIIEINLNSWQFTRFWEEKSQR